MVHVGETIVIDKVIPQEGDFMHIGENGPVSPIQQKAWFVL
jgi:hypothetical protein